MVKLVKVGHLKSKKGYFIAMMGHAGRAVLKGGILAVAERLLVTTGLRKLL